MNAPVRLPPVDENPLSAARTRHKDFSKLFPVPEEGPDEPKPVRRPSPAMQAAIAAFEDHAVRWVQARRDALAGSDAQPCRDARGIPVRRLDGSEHEPRRVL